LTIRVRLGAGLSTAPLRTVEVAEGATVGDVLVRLAEEDPELASTLRAVLTVVAGEHVTRDQLLTDGQEVALLIPISGGGR
jgi:molybdopterin converting factor small subunit